MQTSKMNEKENFAAQLAQFVGELSDHVSTDDGQWTVKGFVDIYKNICNYSPTAFLRRRESSS